MIIFSEVGCADTFTIAYTLSLDVYNIIGEIVEPQEREKAVDVIFHCLVKLPPPLDVIIAFTTLVSDAFK